MIAFWMVWSAWIGALIVVAALGAERMLSAWKRASRYVWVVALTVIVAAAAVGVATTQSSSAPLRPAPSAIVTLGPRSASGQPARPAGLDLQRLAEQARDAWVARLTPLDTPLLVLWVLGSLALSGRLAHAAVRLRKQRRAWEPSRLDGVDVLLTDRVGPAVVGIRSPAIAIPRWVLEYDARLRGLVLAHEREHVAARDSALTTGALAIAVAISWNPAAWWALARLRRAVEVDCDRRVLRAEPSSRLYQLVLVDAARRQRECGADGVALAPAFVHSRARRSVLEHRLAALEPNAKWSPVRRVAAFVLAAGLALAIGCETPLPAGPPAAGSSSLPITDVGGAMPTRSQIVEFLRKHALQIAWENVEIFDEAAMRREYGVSKMPEIAFDAAEVDAAVRRELAAEAPGRKISGRVLLSFDLDHTGRITELQVVDPTPIPSDHIVLAVMLDGSGKTVDVEDVQNEPSDDALKRAAHSVMSRLARFTPAELDGRPVPFKGFRIGYEYEH